MLVGSQMTFAYSCFCMTHVDQDVAFHGRTFAELHKWIHDLRTPLSVISMGIDALKRARHDDGQFVELTQMIDNEGIKPLVELLETLGDPEANKPS